MPDVSGHTPSKKLYYFLISPQNIYLKFLGNIRRLLENVGMNYDQRH